MRNQTLLLLLSAILVVCCKKKPPEATVKDGILDLTNYTASNFTVQLNGQWIFDWKSLRTLPSAFTSGKKIAVPGSWADYSRPGWLGTNTGYCSYGLTVLHPGGQQRLRLFLPVINSAYILFINGKPLLESGRISKGSDMIPAAGNRSVEFETSGSKTEIVLQVSNYHFISGGIWTPLVLGSARSVAQYESDMNFNSAFLIGALMLIGVYHLCLFFLWKKDYSPLYFAMICLFTALRESFGGPAFFFSIFPSIPYDLALKILYLSFPTGILFFSLFFAGLLKSVPGWFKKILTGICMLYISTVLITPNLIYAGLLPLISVVFAFVMSYFVILSVKHYWDDPSSNTLIITGLLTLIICFINDNLFERGIVQSYFLLPLGVLIFTICQSVLLAIRFSRAFKESENLAAALFRSQELKAIEEFKNRFFANITHEFRTPLMLILSPVEELIARKEPDPWAEKSLHTVKRNATSLLRLINQILDISKADSGNLQVSFSKTDVANFFQLMAENFSALAREKKILLEYEHHGEQAEVTSDWEKIEKATYNLLMNAMKFTPAGGSVMLKTKVSESELSVVVSDTGCGISEEQQSDIFERFYQVPQGGALQSGTGLGLSLVNELARIMEGSISVRSSSGQGAVFTFTVPLTGTESVFYGTFNPQQMLVPQPDYQLKMPEISPNTDLETILVVEDNQELAEFIIHILKDKYNVIWEPNGRLGLNTCKEMLPPLVITDIMMPEMNGIELCSEIKTNDETDHIGVILLTAKTAMESRLDGLSKFANDYLTKPFNAEELRLRIDNFFIFRGKMKLHFRKNLKESSTGDSDVFVSPFLMKVYGYLDARLDNSSLSVEELSSALAVSQRTLARKLSSLLGYSPSEVIRRYRLRKATELLKSGINISEAAYAVGFESPSYFSQCFREVYQMTPSEFQK